MTTAPEADAGVSYASGPAGPVAYRITGADHHPTAVFIHGVNMASGVWDRVIERMPGYRCIALDLRGHGLSAQHGPFMPDDYLADVEAVFDAAGVESAHLVGVSIGGLLSCALAHQRPERVRSVLAFGSSFVGRHRGIEDGMKRLREMGVADYFAWSLPRGSLPPNVSPEARQRAVDLAVDGRTDVSMVEQIIRSIFQRDLGYLVPGPVDAPVLVVTGEFDGTCTPEGGQALAAVAGGRWELMPGAGHVIPLERPDACAGLVTGFLRESAGARDMPSDQA